VFCPTDGEGGYRPNGPKYYFTGALNAVMLRDVAADPA
jgi:hypothetical protein